MPTRSEKLGNRFLLAARIAAWLAMADAAIVLVLWRSGFDRALSWLDAKGTKPLTAVCLLLLAVSVLLLSRPDEIRGVRWGRIFAAIGAVIGLTSLLEYFVPLQLGTLGASWAESLLSSVQISDPRLAPLTALGFGSLGMALLLIGGRGELKQCPGQWLAFVPLAVSLLALLGHAYEVVWFYRIGSNAGVAIPSAVGMLLLAAAVLFVRPFNAPMALFCGENIGGFVARRIVPAAILFPIVTGWLELEGEKRGLYAAALGVPLLVVVNILFFTVLIAFVAQKLASIDIQRNESAVLLRGTLESTEDFIAVLDPEFRWVAFNDAHRREFHSIYGEEPRLGESMLDCMSVQQDKARGREIWGRALGGEAFRLTADFGDPRRARKWYEIRFTPIRNAKGKVIAAAQIVRDMTAWHRTQESLRKARDTAEHSHAQQQAIVQSMAEGVVVINREGEVVDANRSGLSILGFETLEEMREMVAEAAQRFEVRDANGNVLPVDAWPNVRALRGETFTNDELMVRRTDGSHTIFVGFGGAPVRDAAGEIILAVVTLRDVTKEREAEQQLALARQQLEEHAQSLEQQVQDRTAKLTESLHEMERFSYSLSHDMRAPLRAMKGFSQMLELEFGEKLGESGKMYLGRIGAAAGRLDQLIQDVLTYSRIVRERIKLEPVDVDRLTRELIEENPSFQSPAADVQIDGKLAPMTGHVAYITQVVTNLVSNAVKFIAPGEKAHVRIWSVPHQEKVRLFIRDQGIGINQEAQAKLFGMFQRLNPSYEGTGIGLNIVRKAVERMGGMVGVESEPGRGTTFWVELDAATLP